MFMQGMSENEVFKYSVSTSSASGKWLDVVVESLLSWEADKISPSLSVVYQYLVFYTNIEYFRMIFQFSERPCSSIMSSVCLFCLLPKVVPADCLLPKMVQGFSICCLKLCQCSVCCVKSYRLLPEIVLEIYHLSKVVQGFYQLCEVVPWVLSVVWSRTRVLSGA